MTEEQQRRVDRDKERMARLLTFIKGEVSDVTVHARLQFTIDLFTYLQPELKVLIADKRIEGMS